MPTVAIVEGVRIRFYPQEHPPPHVHAVIAEYRARIAIEPLPVLDGNLPPAKLAIVLSWAEPRTQVLLDTWHTVLAKKKPEKIR
jgi:sugar phosphate isomerase/epimerase